MGKVRKHREESKVSKNCEWQKKETKNRGNNKTKGLNLPNGIWGMKKIRTKLNIKNAI